MFKFKKKPAPIHIRETLFGDMALDQWPREGAVTDIFPWTEFVSARSHLAAKRHNDAIACWHRVLQSPGLEPRQYLQAWHFLRLQGQLPLPEMALQIFGVVVEVGMQGGIDLLAAYSDHSARYYNYSGAGVVWEHPDPSLDSEIDQLLDASRQVVERIGPWEKPRPAPPPRDQARVLPDTARTSFRTGANGSSFPRSVGRASSAVGNSIDENVDCKNKSVLK